MSTGILDDFLKGKAAKNPFANDENDQMAPFGTSVTGEILDIQVRQTRNVTTNEPEEWPDGNPKQQAIITLQTKLREDAEDDGQRTVYIKLWGLQKKALIEASREAGGGPVVRDSFTATFTGLGKKTNPAFSAPKLYKYEIKKASPLDAVVSPAPAEQWAQPVATPAPAPTAAGMNTAVADQIKKLIGLGLQDGDIATALSIDIQTAAAVRLQAAADGSQGF
ncbi:hypothetical protein [Microbacterium sp. zg-YB36]|uniref:hypothetical protein n=1 Tax=Microbacterium sp. zg-YB36 TaxID=2969407 RepID=UPI00214ADB29|nr:hypothetical protein [Microbacterium sp. zg-YB36]MDL5351126.1 hypothetical protein [Microbacterium sp. zg-YB36]